MIGQAGKHNRRGEEKGNKKKATFAEEQTEATARMEANLSEDWEDWAQEWQIWRQGYDYPRAEGKNKGKKKRKDEKEDQEQEEQEQEMPTKRKAKESARNVDETSPASKVLKKKGKANENEEEGGPVLPS